MLRRAKSKCCSFDTPLRYRRYDKIRGKHGMCSKPRPMSHQARLLNLIPFQPSRRNATTPSRPARSPFP